MSHLQPLLDLEERENLWQPAVNGLSLWAAVRTTVLLAAVQRMQQYSTAHADRKRMANVLPPRLWDDYLQFSRMMMQRGKRYDVIMFKDALTRNGDKDRIFSALCTAFDAPLVFETNFTGKPVGRVFYTEDVLRLYLYAGSRLLRLDGASRRTVHDFSVYLADLYALPDMQPELQDRITTWLVSFGLLKRFLEGLLPRLTSRTAIVNTASYSNWSSMKVKAFHDLGFQVMEPQHGTIYAGHFAYQYAPSCYAPDHVSREYLPDVLLTFGEHWNSAVSPLYHREIIGQPYLNALAYQAKQGAELEANSILFISQGTVTGQMVDLALAVVEAFPEKRIIFKLHPGEIAFEERYQRLQSVPNVTIIGRSSVYDLLARHDTIIGHSSTVLYEALAFGEKRIFILENPILTEPIGQHFRTAADLIAGLQKSQHTMPVSPEIFWARVPDERIREILHADYRTAATIRSSSS